MAAHGQNYDYNYCEEYWSDPCTPVAVCHSGFYPRTVFYGPSANTPPLPLPNQYEWHDYVDGDKNNCQDNSYFFYRYNGVDYVTNVSFSISSLRNNPRISLMERWDHYAKRFHFWDGYVCERYTEGTQERNYIDVIIDEIDWGSYSLGVSHCQGNGNSYSLSAMHSNSRKGIRFRLKKASEGSWTDVSATAFVPGYLDPGTYYLQAYALGYDNGDYYSATRSFEVLPPPPTASVSGALWTCQADPTAAITISNLRVYGGVPSVVALLNTVAADPGKSALEGVSNANNLSIYNNLAYYRIPSSGYASFNTLLGYSLQGASNNPVAAVVKPPPGTYYLFLANGGSYSGYCPSSPYVVTIKAYPLPSLTVQGATPACYGVANGAVAFSASIYSGGTFSSWVAGEGLQGALPYVSGEQSLRANKTGQYTVQVAASTCPQDVVQQSFTITQQARLPDALQVVHPSCTNPWNGVVTLEGAELDPSGYLMDKTWVFDEYGQSVLLMSKTVSMTSFMMQGLRAGVYRFGVSLASDERCTLSSTLQVVLNEPLAPAIEAQVRTPVRCWDFTGEMVVRANSPMAVLYGGQLVATITLSQTVEYVLPELGAGTYTLVLHRNASCLGDMATVTVLLTEPLPLQVSFTVNPIRCFDSNTGALTAIPEGGTPPYAYYWHDRGVEWPERVALGRGIYTVTIRDENDCLLVGDYVLVEPPPLGVRLSEIAPVPCWHTVGSGVTITVAHAQQGYSYELWRSYGDGVSLYAQTGSVTVDETYVPLPAGGYTLVMHDGMECPAGIDFVVSEPLTKLHWALNTFDQCPGLSKGVMEVRAGGGNGAPYTYLVADDLGASVSSVTIEDTSIARFDLPQGDYNVRLADGGGCQMRSSFTIKPSQETRPVFEVVVASSSNLADRVLMRDVSRPSPDSIRWYIPPSLNVVDTIYCGRWLAARDVGEYGVTLVGFWKSCSYALTKSVSFNYSFNPFTEAFALRSLPEPTLFPNPSEGFMTLFFDVPVGMPLELVVFTLNSSEVWRHRVVTSVQPFSLPIDLADQPAGQYIFLLQTPIKSFFSFFSIIH